ncbi:MAG: HAMP domain-containing protein [Lachnospiraceae bacterium]|nr:HAMP domain-containing protein [Lachnospiraceae bacterium]
MKRSIRARYTLIIVGVLVAVLAAVFLFVNFGLESFIANSKVRRIESTIDVIENAVEDGFSETTSFGLMKIASQNNFGISIYHKNEGFYTKAFSTNFNPETIEKRFVSFISSEGFEVEEIFEQEDEYVIYRIFDNRMNGQQIECMGSDGDYYYVITTSMAGITDSVQTVSLFLLFAIVIGAVVAAVIVYVVCRKITKPVVALAVQSEKISNLDFSGRYAGKSFDEIGILGTNINKMSDHLKQTIDELKEANTKLEADIAEKETINRAQREFLGNVSHELKTPIALIQGYAEGLRDGIADDPENARFYTDVIVDEANRMNTIVKRLLNLDEIESGRIEPVLEDFDLVAVIKGVVSSSQGLSKDKNTKIKLIVPEKLIVKADGFMIEQALINYFNNACNHVSDDGTIVVTAKENGENGAYVSVFNTGKQIPQEDMDRLWEKFYKVDKAHTRSYGGSGIGLSVVKTIIDAHHGRVGVENAEDGVVFSFTI